MLDLQTFPATWAVVMINVLLAQALPPIKVSYEELLSLYFLLSVCFIYAHSYFYYERVYRSKIKSQFSRSKRVVSAIPEYTDQHVQKDATGWRLYMLLNCQTQQDHKL